MYDIAPTVRPAPVLGRQLSFDDLGVPLSDVTFCVFDLETTGTSPDSCEITEVGAVKVRCGRVLGTFQTLVNPGLAVPPEITVITGITEAMLVPAPPLRQVLPAFLEFAGNSVLVGHNVRFDVSFLRAACTRHGYDPPPTPTVDTCALARRLVRDEVPNCRLSTLASRFRLSHRPAHRALEDALATTDLLHLLLERAGSMGVLALDDLVALPTISGHPQQRKLRLTTDLPRRPGVYLFRDRRGDVLYVGKAADLRSRVRSYFSGDTRRKVGALIRETETIDHVVCPSRLHAAVLEVRLIHHHAPRYNRQAKTWSRAAYVRLTDERFPRLSVVTDPRPDDRSCLGPLTSQRSARAVVDAVERALPVRRCRTRIGPRTAPSAAPCAAAQLGRAACPCSGELTTEAYRAIVDSVRAAFGPRPELVVDPLLDRMHRLAGEERFEEAADARDRLAAFCSAVDRTRRLRRLVDAEEVVLRPGPDIEPVTLVRGILQAAWPDARPPDPPDAGPVPRHLADELQAVQRWSEDSAGAAQLIECTGTWSSPMTRLPVVRASQR